MKPQRAFIAERALAQHCAELVRPVPATSELLARLDQTGAALGQALAAALAPLLGHEVPAVEGEAASECAADALPSCGAAPCAGSLLLAGKERVPVLVSFDGPAILRMVDRAFGGKGTAPNPLPDRLPLSAELMIARLEGLVMAAIGSAWELGGTDMLQLSRRGPSLAPFGPQCRITVQRFTITEPGGSAWPLTLALPVDALAGLIGDGANKPGRAPPARPEANPAEAPYGAMPFALSAVLVDMAMPVSTISALTVGHVLPVSVARSVPLRIGRCTVAHGTIGALDERVAVQITHAF